MTEDPREYALPLVIHVEKAAPPRRTDALEAAARAVLVFLTDPRVTEPDGEWHEEVRAWTGGRIRKVVRRARGASWRRAAGLPGITLTHGTAEVRVYPPVPVDGWPADLARLQVSGTDLEDPETLPIPPNGSPLLYLNPHLSMSAGKAMAQVGHAAQIAWLEADPATRAAWMTSEFPLAVRTASPEQWKELEAGDFPAVRDAGFTEVAPGSRTVIAHLPHPPSLEITVLSVVMATVPADGSGRIVWRGRPRRDRGGRATPESGEPGSPRR